VFGVRYNPNTEQIEWLSATVLIGASSASSGGSISSWHHWQATPGQRRADRDVDLADLAVRCDRDGDSDLDARHEVLLDDRVGHVPGSVCVGGQKDPVR
jgi:hypothetical protein